MNEIKLSDNKVLIIGDHILEEYLIGPSKGLAYEAPVPIVEIKSSVYEIGGVGNLASNIKSMGGNCDVISIIGDDTLGTKIKDRFKELNIPVDKLISCPNFFNNIDSSIICKGKYLAKTESSGELPDDKEFIYASIKRNLETINDYALVIIQDWGKLFIDEVIINMIMTACIENEIKVIFDTPGYNVSNYPLRSLAGVDLYRTHMNGFYTINNIRSGTVISNDELTNLSKAVVREAGINSILVTLGIEGLIYTDTENTKIVECFGLQVYDPTGAGNSLLAAVALGKLSGLEDDVILNLGNIAGGIACRYPGMVSVSIDELMEAYGLLTSM